MRWTHARVALALALPLFTAVGHAQTIRGAVTDRMTALPVAGAVVTLEHGDSAARGEARSVLTTASGTYVIRAPAPGRYRIIVRRIGSQPFRSDEWILATGETRVQDVLLEHAAAVGAILATVSVTRATPCRRETDGGARIATLFEDARTALLATGITARDGLMIRRLLRYQRELDPNNLEIRTEVLHAFDDSDCTEVLFNSLPGDSLSTIGYWRQVNPQVTIYYGLDARALLSEAFVRDHCFTLVEGSDSRQGMTGLAFVPVSRRAREPAPPEIRGTIWLDARTADLRVVDFVWNRLPGRAPVNHIGGEVQFARASDGPWYVDSWRLRIPQDVLEIRGSGNNVIRTQRMAIIEEGGLIHQDSIDATRMPATITGVVRNASRRALAGAVVRVVGTDLRAVTGADGRYTLAGVPPGLQFVVAEHESLDGLGVRLGQVQVLLDEGMPRDVSFRGPAPDEIMRTRCGDHSDTRTAAMLRVALTDSVTTGPLAGVRLRLAYADPDRSPPLDMEDETDAAGTLVFCHVPASHELRLTAPGLDGRVLLTITPEQGSVNGRRLFVRR
jgi:hypothetical protein